MRTCFGKGGLGLKLELGKIPSKLLGNRLLKLAGAPSKNIVVPPKLGVDFGVIRLQKGFLIVSSDPITGTTENTGWYAVNVSANDVATSGNRPVYMQSVMLLPEGASSAELQDLWLQVHRSARMLGISITGGHTEVTPKLKRPIVVTTAFAFGDSFVTAADAKQGDSILLTKTAGIEGTSILASHVPKLGAKVNHVFVSRAKKFREKLSVVEEAVAAYKTGSVHAMHDCTEGGVLGAVYEMATASKKGFLLSVKDVPVARETEEVCKAFKIDPLKLIGSGALILAVERGAEPRVKAELEKIGVCATKIGEFTKRGKILVHPDGGEEKVFDAPVDELWRVEAMGYQSP
jgi:hydrogenase expression/formation protein HypE